MNRFFGIALAAVLAGGCVAFPVGGSDGTRFYIPYQVGVFARVVNNCAPYLDLETVNGIVQKGLPYGSSATIPLISTPFGGSYRQMALVAKGYNEKREYLGSVVAVFHVSTYQGSQAEVWVVDRLHLPGGRGGCQ